MSGDGHIVLAQDFVFDVVFPIIFSPVVITNLIIRRRSTFFDKFLFTLGGKVVQCRRKHSHSFSSGSEHTSQVDSMNLD
jgi:hypothetical protein